MRKFISGCLFLAGVSLTGAQAQAQSVEGIISEYADLLVLADLCPMLTFNATEGQFPQFFIAKKFNQKLIAEYAPYFDDLKLAEKAAFEKRMYSSGRFNCQDAVKKYGVQGDVVPGIISATSYNFDLISNKPMREVASNMLNIAVAGDICGDDRTDVGKALFDSWIEANPYIFSIIDRDKSYDVLNGSRIREIFESRKKLSVEENCLFVDTLMKQL